MQPLSFAAFAIICAVLAMQAASPTDVPPNFMTWSRGFISLLKNGIALASF
jgi:hypothetical protein